MFPIQITVRGIATSPALEAHIRQRAEKLTRFCKRISSCRIVLELAQKHKHQGKLFNARIDLTMPRKELVVTRKTNQDIYVAIRDAFAVLGRRLEEHARKRNGHVKVHEESMHGRIARMMQQEGYGFIEGTDGNEYYFSITNVSYPSFNKLLIGDSVEYIPQTFADGRQAHHVVLERHLQAA